MSIKWKDVLQPQIDRFKLGGGPLGEGVTYTRLGSAAMAEVLASSLRALEMAEAMVDAPPTISHERLVEMARRKTALDRCVGTFAALTILPNSTRSEVTTLVFDLWNALREATMHENAQPEATRSLDELLRQAAEKPLPEESLSEGMRRAAETWPERHGHVGSRRAGEGGPAKDAVGQVQASASVPVLAFGDDPRRPSHSLRFSDRRIQGIVDEEIRHMRRIDMLVGAGVTLAIVVVLVAAIALAITFGAYKLL